MQIETNQLVGTWRHVHQNIFTDFTIWNSDGQHKAMFTIYEREPENKTNHEWHGRVEVVNTEDLPVIEISDIKFTDENPEYQNLVIWQISNETLTLQLGSGAKLLLNKLLQTFERVS